MGLMWVFVTFHCVCLLPEVCILNNFAQDKKTDEWKCIIFLLICVFSNLQFLEDVF